MKGHAAFLHFQPTLGIGGGRGTDGVGKERFEMLQGPTCCVELRI